MTRSFVLTFVCDDRPGIVADVTARLFELRANITEAAQFEDHATGRFFMRLVIKTDADVTVDRLTTALANTTLRFGMKLMLRPLGQKKKVLILVSRQDHCLGDLLYRTRIGELAMDVAGVISNHPKESLNLTSIGEIPYHHLPVTAGTKAEQESKIERIVEGTGAELVILARYMQVLSADLVRFLSGRCINIHHSFLPGFKGAKPYHQAFEKGVKLIGATAHFVTADLDEGPIIEQNVERVNHTDSPQDMIRKGRDVERRVLATAVGYMLEDRVLLNGRKTVVFRN
jgi:formyltetrahydrofolate deformylase